MPAKSQPPAKPRDDDRRCVRVTRCGAIGVVRVDNPPVNALSHGVRAGLWQAAQTIAANDTIKAAVLICAGRTFIAGADISEFGKPALAPSLPDVIDAIEASNKPWIAALHGTVLGGGLEVALGCHSRIASTRTKLGLPEVTLGLIPGAGGTQRLPRLIGLHAAIDMITSGQSVDAASALKIRLIDCLAQGDLEQKAIDHATQLMDQPPRRSSQLPSPVAQSEQFWATQETKTAKNKRGQLAPLKALEAVRAACTMSFTDGTALERQIFTQLREGDQSAALRHVFFAERAASKLPQLQGLIARDITTVGIIGGGTMGIGIAATCLDAGLAVTLIELNEPAAAQATARLQSVYERAVQRRRITQSQGEDRLRRFTVGTSYTDLANADLIIEAIIEERAAKQTLFSSLGEVVKPGTICASNTSYLDINTLADSFKHPANFVGLHFFAPANIMKLVEIIPSTLTSPEVLASCFAFTKKLRKVGVLAGACSGFIGNRILKAYRQQADIILLEGAMPNEVDSAMRGFGMAMGLYEVQDLSGLDIGWAQRKASAAERDPNVRYIAIADTLCQLGRFGQKTGKGWYRYEPGSRAPTIDPEVSAIIADESQRHGVERRTITAPEITARLLLAMINEGAKIVDEKIAQRPLDIDVTMINGYGFARWRGGLMWHGDQIGTGEIKKQIDVLAVQDPASWQCAALITRLAAQHKSFSTLNQLPGR